MRGTMLRGLLVAVVMLTAAAVFAQTDEQTDAMKFQHRVAKYAPDFDKNPRGLCVCQDGSASHGRAGELRRINVNQVVVTCSIPAFDGLGNLSAYDTCRTFVPLAH